MTCDRASGLLSAFADRELDLLTSAEVEEHLASCERCSRSLQRHRELGAALRDAPLAFAPPADLAPRIRAAVRREARVAALPSPRWAAPWIAVPLAAAAGALLTWAVTARTTRGAAADLVLADLVSGHVRSLMADHLLDVASTDQHTVKPWFNGKIDFAPPVPDFSREGFPLLGGRVDYVAGHPAAVLVYGHRQHVVNVYVWPAAEGGGSGPAVASEQGFQLRRWTVSGLEFGAVSDVNEADLETLAHLFGASS